MSPLQTKLRDAAIDGQNDLYDIINKYSSTNKFGGCRQIDMMSQVGNMYICFEYKLLSKCNFWPVPTYQFAYNQIKFAKNLLKDKSIPTILMVRDRDDDKIYVVWVRDLTQDSYYWASQYKSYNIKFSHFVELDNVDSLDKFIIKRYPDIYDDDSDEVSDWFDDL